MNYLLGYFNIISSDIMHRKYVKGKRSNKQQGPAQRTKFNDKKMVQSDIPHMPEFLSRVANIPVVHSAIDYASDAYGKAKVFFIPFKSFIETSK